MKNTAVISWLTQYLKDPLRKNSVFLIATHVLLAIFGFFFWMIAARLYSPEEVGLATALISAILLLLAFSRLGVDIGLIRFLPSAEDKPGMINTCFTLVGLFSMLLALLFILGLNLWSPALLFIREKVSYFLLFILFTGVTSVAMLLQQGVFVALRTTEFSLIMQAIAGLRLLLLVLLMAFGTLAIFSSWGLAWCAALIAAILLTIRLQPKYRPIPGVQKRIVNDMLHFSLGNYVAESFRELPGFLLPLLIVNILEPEMGAYFYIAWTIVGVLFMISHAANFSLLAESSYQPEKLQINVMRTIKFIFMLLTPAILLIFFLGDMILSLGFGEEYSENGFKLLWILALSGIPLAFNTVYITVKRVQKELKPVIYVYAFIALSTIGVSYALMSKEGLVGLGIAWLLSHGVVTLFIGLATIRRWAQSL